MSEVKVTFVLLKVAPGNPQVTEDLKEYDAEVREVVNGRGGQEAFKVWVSYIVGVSNTPESELRPWAASFGPDAEETYVTTADMLKARGQVLGEARLLMRVLTARFGTLPEATSEKINGASAAELETWADRAGTVATLDEVFA